MERAGDAQPRGRGTLDHDRTAGEAPSSRAGARLSLALVVAALALCGAIWGGLLFHVAERERAAHAGAARDASNLAIALEEQVERTFKGHDQVLRFAQASFEEAPEAFDLWAFARRLGSVGEGLHQISIADANGVVRSSSLAPGADRGPVVSIADREHFQVHARDPEAGLHISRPVLGRISGRWSIQLSRRLTGGDGSFAGVVVISLDPDHLSQLFATIDVGEAGAVSLLGRDGFIRARSPMLPGLYEGSGNNRRARMQSACGGMLPGTGGICRFASSLDGIERIQAYRAPADLPLIVAVGKSVAAIDATAAVERRRVLAIGAAFTVALAAGLFLLLRELSTRARREAALAASETRLREAEAEYRALFENAVVGIYRSLPCGRQLRANPALVRLNGYGSETEMLAAVQDISAEWYVDPNRRAEFMRLMSEDGRVTDFVSEVHRHKTRERIWVSETAWTVRGPEGEALYYEGTVVEATDRVHAEARVAASEARYRLLADNSSDLIVLKSMFGGARSYVSPAVRPMLGYEPEEFAGIPTAELVHPDDLPAVSARYGRLGPDCPQITSEHRLRHKVGHWVWIEVVFRWTGDAKGTANVIGTFRDVGERKAAQAAMAETEARLRFALAAGRMYAWERDIASTTVARHGAVADVLGFDPEASADAFNARVHPHDRELVDAAARAAIRDGDPYEVEFRFERPDGACIWLLDVGRRVRVGERERFLGLCLDITRRREAEEALARKTGLLEATLANMDQGLVMIAPDGGIEVHNRRFAELLDIPAATLAGERPSFEDVLEHLCARGEFGKADADFQAHAANRGAPLTQGMYERERPDGTILEVRTTPVPDESGAVVRTYTDVTAHRRAEVALRQSEARHRLLADHATDMIVQADLDTTRRYVSPACRELLGFEPEELVGTRPLDGTHPEDATGLARILAELTAGRIDTATSIHRYRRRDGSWVWVEGTFRLLREEATGRPTGYVASVRDIAVRRRAEAALRESERLYRLLADNSSDLIVLGHADGRRSYISPAVTPMLGYTVEEAHRVPMREWVHPDDLEGVFAATRGLCAERPQASVVYRLRRKEGGYVWVEAAFRRVVEESGEVTIITAIRDVSERRAQAEALAVAKEAAEAASAAKSEFLASMSHEVRTPLNGVLGYTELLLDDPGLSEEQRRNAERIQGAGSALLTVVNDILDFSKIEAGQVELDERPFALDALVDNAASIVRGLAAAKRIPVEVTIHPAVPRDLVGDPDRLRQVLLNLLNNAVKFTPYGQIALRVDALAGTGADCTLRFAVTDTGIGIAPEKRSRLFQRFSQVDGSIRREFGGTGLGLAISKSLVELMGGEIGVESIVGQGSTFWFHTPLRRACATVEIAAQAGAAERASRPARILLVEDLDINQRLARAVLEAAGHSVDVVGDGADAVMAVQTRRYDVVLMDVQMPGMDGVTATRHIRALDGPAARVPIIAMTANVLPQQVAEFRAAGMDDHVGKPFRRAELYAAIESSMPGEPAEVAAGHRDAPVVDIEHYDSVRDLLGTEQLLGLLASLAEQLQGAFWQACLSSDGAELAAEAHKMVSAAGMLGFSELSALCAALEEACLAGAETNAVLSSVSEARARVLERITELRHAA